MWIIYGLAIFGALCLIALVVLFLTCDISVEINKVDDEV